MIELFGWVLLGMSAAGAAILTWDRIRWRG